MIVNLFYMYTFIPCTASCRTEISFSSNVYNIIEKETKLDLSEKCDSAMKLFLVTSFSHKCCSGEESSIVYSSIKYVIRKLKD